LQAFATRIVGTRGRRLARTRSRFA
jgi:hypothetical protein